jgi:hypothetical protein
MARKLVTPIVLLLCFCITGTAFGLNMSGTRVVIPIIGRFPGASGTQWRTDVFVSNFSSVQKDVELTFHVSGGATLTHTATMLPLTELALRDIVLTTFSLPNASGMLEVKSSTQSTVEVRARIYNAGHPAGEFGQSVQGINFDALSRQAFMHGLSGINGNRVNIGVANPNDVSIPVDIRIITSSGTSIYDENFSLGPHQVVQFNDIFARFGLTPQADLMIDINTFDSQKPLYGYASEVRNDTGDAIFLFGTSPNS